MSAARYTISLRIFHPTRRANDIAKHIGLNCRIRQSAGDGRQTSNGNKLEGIYDRTFVLFDIPEEKGKGLEDVLRKVLKENLSTSFDFIGDLDRTGGRSEFFIGIFCDKNIGIQIDGEIVQSLALAKIGLSFDFYGDSY